MTRRKRIKKDPRIIANAAVQLFLVLEEAMGCKIGSFTVVRSDDGLQFDCKPL